MMQQAGRRILERMREWPSGAGDAHRRIRDWGTAAGRLPRRMGGRPAKAWSIRRPAGTTATRLRHGLAAWAAAGAVLAVAGILLYLRKRRQVAAHYTMGEGRGVQESGTAGALLRAEASRS